MCAFIECRTVGVWNKGAEWVIAAHGVSQRGYSSLDGDEMKVGAAS